MPLYTVTLLDQRKSFNGYIIIIGAIVTIIIMIIVIIVIVLGVTVWVLRQKARKDSEDIFEG